MGKQAKLTIYTDGGSRGNPGPAGIGVHVIDEDGTVVYEFSGYLGTKTNNEAEYLALIESLEWLNRQLSSTPPAYVTWLLDSNLVVQQVQGNWKIKQEHIQALVNQVHALLAPLPCSYEFRHIPRSKNARADALVNQALDAHKE